MSRRIVAPGDLADWLIGQGRHFLTTEQAAELLGIAARSAPDSLERSREAGKVLSVTKGAWIPVPPEHRSAGAPPASHFIDPLMGHLGHPYYVGLLSAAALHGAAHQSPMVFQVVTDARMRNRQIGRNRLTFLQRHAVAERSRERRTVPTGRMWVSTVATTVLDLVESPADGGGLSNVATILGELLLDERVRPTEIATASVTYSTAVIQRAGHLLDRIAAELQLELDTDPLHDLASASRYRPLDPAGGDGPRDPRWRLIVNTGVEPDL